MFGIGNRCGMRLAELRLLLKAELLALLEVKDFGGGGGVSLGIEFGMLY